MKHRYNKPVVSTRSIRGGYSLLASSNITINKSTDTYSGSFHAKRFMAWDDDAESNANGNY